MSVGISVDQRSTDEPAPVGSGATPKTEDPYIFKASALQVRCVYKACECACGVWVWGVGSNRARLCPRALRYALFFSFYSSLLVHTMQCHASVFNACNTRLSTHQCVQYALVFTTSC
jgi:hypothetical protein